MIEIRKRILYIDMDNDLVDFKSGIDTCTEEILAEYEGQFDEIPEMFSRMRPIERAVASYELLSSQFDTYILSTSPWENPSAWSDKLVWVKTYLGQYAYKRLILTHHKHLNKGDYLVDDRTKNSVDRFEGELIQFESDRFPDWQEIPDYLMTVQKREI